MSTHSSPTPPRRPSPGFSLPRTPPPGTASPAPQSLTLTGVVEAGVEANCLVLTHQGVTYLLLDADRAIVRPGARVTVRGRTAPGVATTCMQGLPFEVSEAYPA